MSDSNWRKGTKARLIVSLLAATVVCVSIIGYGLWEGSKYEWQANDERSKYAEYTKQKIAETCVGIPDFEAIKCRYDALDAQREHDNNQRDLVAQRQSALWAYIMGAAAVVGIALSAVGVWLVKTTFDETRVANAIARESMQRQLRAYVGAFKIRVENFRPNCVPHFKFSPTNTGQTPAYNLEITSVVIFASDLERGMFKFGKVKPDSKTVLQPNQPASLELKGPRAITMREYSAIQDGSMFCIVSGYIRYRTAFGQLRRTVFSAYVQTGLLDGRGCGSVCATKLHNVAN